MIAKFDAKWNALFAEQAKGTPFVSCGREEFWCELHITRRVGRFGYQAICGVTLPKARLLVFALPLTWVTCTACRQKWEAGK